jgi:catechol 2,3-dioxygenase-like lactoylglutathione lyase family enzyme
MSDQTTLTLSTLGQIALVVSNIDTATGFYKETLGLPFLFSAPPKLAFFDLNGVRLMIAEPENASESNKVGNNSTLYFTVDDIQATYDTLAARGVMMDDKPHIIANLGAVELWMAFFRDPDHNLIGIMSEVPVKA